MKTHPITILLNADLPPEAQQQLSAIVPAAHLLTKQDVEADPRVLAEVNIVYGGVGPEQWALMPNLRWVQTTWAGMEGMLTPEAVAHPAVITNARIHAEPIAEHLFAMLLAFARALPIAIRQQPEGRWDSSSIHREVITLPGKTLGILGLGSIGRRCAELGSAFGMRVLGLRAHPEPMPGVERVYSSEQKHEMLAQCDVVMNLLPLTPKTRRFLAEAELAVMKPTALLFNAGRGATIDTDALVRALQEGKIRGAGLDVTDPEPLPPDHPLWTLPNVIITPHYAGSFPGYMESAARVFLDNLRRYLDEQPLQFQVAKAAGY